MLVGNTVLRGNRYNQWMNRTRVAPVFVHKVQEESALYVLGKRRQRADYLGR